ncbi:MAG: 2-phospho-L-lactate transferase [Candidatus Dormibacteria bacterium]
MSGASALDRGTSAGTAAGGQKIVVLAGGVGAARFLSGLVDAVPGAEITVIGNTGDDFLVHGMHVSPDLDSVTYTLCGIGDEQRGWGIRQESWRALEQLRRLGEECWFQLGDRDLATHIFRTQRLSEGVALSEVTRELGLRLGLPLRLLPMTDQGVTTRIHTEDGRDLHIQEYLVREACQPVISAVEFRGAELARPAAGVLEAIRQAEVVIFAPSNPVISIGPILSIPQIREAVGAAPLVAAVSPIVVGRAIKGPAAAMLQALGLEVSPSGVADYYGELVQLLVVDEQDRGLLAALQPRRLVTHLCDTMMVSAAARRNLALEVLRACHLTQPVATK